MGVAAYSRGSASIRAGIERDFMVDRGGERRLIIDSMTRAELKVIQLEQFCIDAQSLFSEASSEDTAKGLLRRWMFEQYLKKGATQKFAAMLSECNQAHCDWVDSDHRHVFLHLAKCKRKAAAWLAVLTLLNKNEVDYPFAVPSM
jgi:hypothetical protein